MRTDREPATLRGALIAWPTWIERPMPAARAWRSSLAFERRITATVNGVGATEEPTVTADPATAETTPP